MKRLSQAQRRVMQYLTHGQWNYAQFVPTSRAYVIKDGTDEVILRDVHRRTVRSLEDLGLVDKDNRNVYAATPEAWALAHKGGLR